MVKCWGICFSLCCALCSPPQRTRGGSNTAATVKKEDNPREIRINLQHQDCKHNILLPPSLCVRRSRDRCLRAAAPAYIEFFSEELAIICRAYPVLLLQGAQRDREVPLGQWGRSREEDHCLLACVQRNIWQAGCWHSPTGNITTSHCTCKNKLDGRKDFLLLGTLDRYDFFSHKHAAGSNCLNSEFLFFPFFLRFA